MLRRRIGGGGDGGGGGARAARAEDGEVAVGAAAVDDRSGVLARFLRGIGVLERDLEIRGN